MECGTNAVRESSSLLGVCGWGGSLRQRALPRRTKPDRRSVSSGLGDAKKAVNPLSSGFVRFARGEKKLQEPSVQHPERPAETASPTRQAVERSRNVIEIGRKFASGSPFVRINLIFLFLRI